MPKMLSLSVLLSLSMSAFAAQPQTPTPASDLPQVQELTPQMLGEMLRAATTFHELVTKLNLNRTLGPDQHVLGADGQYHHSLNRTAAFIGAGAGAGAAIGGMTRSTNGVLIGAIVGSAGGLILDQIMRQREEARDRVTYDSPAETSPHPRELERR